MKRNRILFALMAGLVILMGLASRYFARYLPDWNRLYLGDALWACMVFFLVGLIFFKKSTQWVTIVALFFSFAIEFSQLYHAPWIDSIRNTRPGGLVLGYGFLWSDLICYLVGIGMGVLIECMVLKHWHKVSRKAG